MRFEWGPQKAQSNQKKHGVSFEEAATVFTDLLALFVEDESHEERMVLIGESGSQRILFVVFVEPDEDSIRIISARRTTSRERRRYEEGEF